ncbi:MAG TPA: EAL domain-containing protein, partial [Alphaproteobacteria bacterium]|nr:EAL domain-containing protein [Alphaproteobacteria bacterium]
RAWELEGRPLRMAVNLSGQQISTDGLVGVVRGALERTGLSPRLLELEITEGHILKRVEHCIDTLRELKGLGITLAIDDFGTGYSSLSYLKRLPVDRLKIDRSFVEGVPADHDDSAIVATILAMARNLGLAGIAEGVETEDQLGHLAAAGCDEYQGYLLGRPMPAAAIGATLA